MHSGSRWRKHRRIIQERFGPRYLNDYAGMRKRVTYTFLADLGRTPDKFGDHIKRQAALSRQLYAVMTKSTAQIRSAV